MTIMAGPDPVSTAWRAHRPYLVDLAFRMLGDLGRAEDVVQEAFSRLLQAQIDQIEDQRGWLVVVTSRLCLDEIKSARARRELAVDAGDIDAHTPGRQVDPVDRVTLDDNLRIALAVVLERLSPAERVAFVLHDIFGLPFDTIAETVGRTSASCRQLARRARRKVEAADATQVFDDRGDANRHITDTFIKACANGDLTELLGILDPDVSGTIDTRARLVVAGAQLVARNLLRYWSRPEHTLVSQTFDAQPALLGFTDRQLTGIFLLTVAHGRIVKIHVLADPHKLDLVRSQLPDLSFGD
jgi:RNA polymerase sigma-70 factor (ECF subfamily)